MKHEACPASCCRLFLLPRHARWTLRLHDQVGEVGKWDASERVPSFRLQCDVTHTANVCLWPGGVRLNVWDYANRCGDGRVHRSSALSGDRPDSPQQGGAAKSLALSRAIKHMTIPLVLGWRQDEIWLATGWVERILVSRRHGTYIQVFPRVWRTERCTIHTQAISRKARVMRPPLPGLVGPLQVQLPIGAVRGHLLTKRI